MKASIALDKSTSVPKLHGSLGIANAAYTATLELTHPDGRVDNLVVPQSGSDAWEYFLDNMKPGTYVALITPREHGTFEATRLEFTL